MLRVVLNAPELQWEYGALESDRKREILIAEERFERLQQLSARLAAAGVYVIGPLNPGLDADPRIPDAAVIEQERPERDAAE